MNIRPIGEKILLSVPEKSSDEVVDGGIIIKRHQKRESHREAVVKALGPKYNGFLAVGDIVFIGPWTGHEVVINGERLLFVVEDDVIAAME